MRTAGLIQQGTPNSDGHVFFVASAARLFSGAGTNTRTAKGINYLAVAASQNIILSVPLTELMFRYGMQDDMQQLYGSTANGGANGKALDPGVNYVQEAPLLSRPPYIGVTHLNPQTGRPTGIGIKNIVPVYQITGAAATLNTIGISKTQFALGSAPVVTDILAPTNIPTAVSGQVTPNAVAVSGTPVFQTSRLAEYIVEWQINTPAGGSVNLFGFFLDLFYNYN